MKRYVLAVTLAVLVAAIFVPAVWGTVFDMRQNQGPSSIEDRYIGLSTDTKPSTLNVVGDTFLETDTGRRFYWTGSAWTALDLLTTAGPDTLSAPGQTDPIYARGQKVAEFMYTVGSINTSVTVAMEGKKSVSAWTALGSTVTQTANGNYGIVDTNIAMYDSLRFNWSAEVGGTAATVIVISTMAKE
jgi:hypothetical protein